jgi:hypothetical protein
VGSDAPRPRPTTALPGGVARRPGLLLLPGVRLWEALDGPAAAAAVPAAAGGLLAGPGAGVLLLWLLPAPDPEPAAAAALAAAAPPDGEGVGSPDELAACSPLEPFCLLLLLLLLAPTASAAAVWRAGDGLLFFVLRGGSLGPLTAPAAAVELDAATSAKAAAGWVAFPLPLLEATTGATGSMASVGLGVEGGGVVLELTMPGSGFEGASAAAGAPFMGAAVGAAFASMEPADGRPPPQTTTS